MAGNESSGEVAEGNLPTFDDIAALLHLELRGTEKPRRHAAYAAVGAEIKRLLPPPVTQAFHSRPHEVHGELGRRSVFLARACMPGHGNLARVIINDEVDDIASRERRLDITDFVVSTVQKTYTLQRTTISRDAHATSWSIKNNEGVGPVLFRRVDRLDAMSGEGYSLHIPKTRGFPMSLTRLMEATIELEQLTEDLQLLGDTSFEPGYPNPNGIMS